MRCFPWRVGKRFLPGNKKFVARSHLLDEGVPRHLPLAQVVCNNVVSSCAEDSHRRGHRLRSLTVAFAAALVREQRGVDDKHIVSAEAENNFQYIHPWHKIGFALVSRVMATPNFEAEIQSALRDINGKNFHLSQGLPGVPPWQYRSRRCSTVGAGAWRPERGRRSQKCEAIVPQFSRYRYSIDLSRTEVCRGRKL